ncbi:glutactin-like [Megalops cyprinoides]|uniref:glutactin-like n=1 Tax=Megalops cyprinoides TaxID=118141 RepID=UPI001864DFAE|nr:glutactin-like [Megalops cyprinoides]
MAAKGSFWSTAEVQCLLEIWADESIQEQLDTTHKNSKIFGIIRDYLHARGYHRTIEQCRDKLKKLRVQYLKVRYALHKSGSLPDEKDKFQWYDAIDKIIGIKPSSKPNVLESYSGTPPAPSDNVTEDTGPASPVSITSLTSDQSHNGEGTHAETDRSTPDRTRSKQSRKRKRKMKTDVSDMMAAFMDMQKKQHDEFMREEQQRHQQEKEMLDNWMKAQMEMEERRQQVQREERQEANRMFQQMMSRLFDVMVPLFQQHTPSHPQHHHPPPLRYSHPAREETPPAYLDKPYVKAEQESGLHYSRDQIKCEGDENLLNNHMNFEVEAAADCEVRIGEDGDYIKAEDDSDLKDFNCVEGN